ncbi:DUF4349 domain-containing protein [Sabulibacter ruber]|uniref:DUF4349 domain-containing protein n=1 Tax=Sabulibacter ruber TaxID=2811901 RepID=UPI001A961338|nr:DUF4349 domain-containing protein [Sabulibacter ruber]
MKTIFRHSFPLLFGASLLFFSGCQGQQEMSVNEAAASVDSAETNVAKEQKAEGKPTHVIRQAEVKFKVENLTASTQRVETLVEHSGAILANSNQHQTDDTRTADFVIRVQPEKFLPLLQQIQKESMQLDVRTITTDDVSMEFVDLEARKKAKLAVEQRFMGLLKEAKDIQQILEVENQLRTIREEIESAEARLTYLQNQTALSTIRLSMYQVVPVTVPEEPGFFTRVLEAVSTGWELLLSLLIGCFYLWPLWLVGAGILIYLRKRSLA